MKDLSLHIADLCQNSIAAKAKNIRLKLDLKQDTLFFSLKDDGKGMPQDKAQAALSPFVTSRTTRKVGLGIPLAKQSAEQSGGMFKINSRENEGTEISASYILSNIDCIPLGDIAGTVSSLMSANDNIFFWVDISKDDKQFSVSTEQLKEILDGIPLYEPQVALWLNKYIEENTLDILGGYIT
ncbi:MAG: ATP-binding protein [Eubacteriales bacterium]|nr:ATP-binding protein [Eubacteriales bacterium]